MKAPEKFLYVQILLLYYFSGAQADCGKTENYVFMDENNYDRNYSSIQSGKKPLGFSSTRWEFNAKKNPCMKITGAAGRRVEVMAETDPASRLCMKVQGQGGTTSCRQTTIYECLSAPADTVIFEFFCDAECSEADVNFWYRFTLSWPPDEGKDLDLWCYMRDTSQFPSSLLAPPIPPVKTTMSTIGAASAKMSVLILIASLGVHLLLRRET